MKKGTFILAILIGALVLSPMALGETENQDELEIAVVDFPDLLSSVMADEDLEGITHEEVDAIAKDLEYEVVVNSATIELYLEGIVDTVSNFATEDVTEKVQDILPEDELEDIDEFLDLPEVKNITQEIFNEL